MGYTGFVMHHSCCSSINGKGFDFWVAKDGSVFAAPLMTDPERIHICVEGDFGSPPAEPDECREQLFAVSKLVAQLSARYSIPVTGVISHDDSCPGPFFPWKELVIYPGGGYH